jgi:hypothetical protein
VVLFAGALELDGQGKVVVNVCVVVVLPVVQTVV